MWGRVLETRRRADGIVRRRYKDENDVLTTTYEVPATVLREFGAKAVERAILRWQRGQEARKRANDRKSWISEHLDWKPAAIAHELGISEARVRQIMAEIKRQSK